MDLINSTDGELASAYALADDEQVFAELVRRHRAMVFKTCKRITGNEHDAEDLTQVVFALLADRSGTLGGYTSLGGWLYTTAWHVASRMMRESQRRRRRERRVAASRPAVCLPQHNGEDVSEPLADALARLPEPLRDAIVLYHFAGLTLLEIAETTGEPVGTVAARLSRARQALRSHLGDRGLTLAAVGLPEGLGFDSPSRTHALANGEVIQQARAQAAGLVAAPATGAGISTIRRLPPPLPALGAPPLVGASAPLLTSGSAGTILASLCTARAVAITVAIALLTYGGAAAAVHAEAMRLRGPTNTGPARLSLRADVQAIVDNAVRESPPNSQKSASIRESASSSSGGGGSINSSIPEPGTTTIVVSAIAALGLRRPRHGGEPRDRR